MKLRIVIQIVVLVFCTSCARKSRCEPTEQALLSQKSEKLFPDNVVELSDRVVWIKGYPERGKSMFVEKNWKNPTQILCIRIAEGDALFVPENEFTHGIPANGKVLTLRDDEKPLRQLIYRDGTRINEFDFDEQLRVVECRCYSLDGKQTTVTKIDWSKKSIATSFYKPDGSTNHTSGTGVNPYTLAYYVWAGKEAEELITAAKSATLRIQK